MSLPAGNYQPAILSIKDAGNEIGRMRVYGTVITAANHDAKAALWATLITKTEALCLGNKTKAVYAEETTYAADQPTDGSAREFKLSVRYKDATTDERMHVSLPCIDPSKVTYVLNDSVKDAVDITTGTEMTEWVSAFEAFAVNPRTGNAVEVTGASVIGRRG